MEKLTIDSEIQRVLQAMKDVPINSEEYASGVKMLKELYEIRRCKKTYFIDPGTILLSLTSLLEILLVLNHEQLHVIGSRAFGLVKRI